MKKLFIGFVAIAIIVGAVWYAPKYLAYSDHPAKADVIVLFAGADWNARKKEALKLMADGYAQRLYIPFFGKLIDEPTSKISGANKPIAIGHYPWYFEKTHIEILEAKKMMDKAGFKSAIFVSSPFHMRRIKVISSKIYSDNNVKFVATRYEKPSIKLWLFNTKAIKNVTNEYLKLGVVLTYRIFAEYTSHAHHHITKPYLPLSACKRSYGRSSSLCLYL